MQGSLRLLKRNLLFVGLAAMQSLAKRRGGLARAYEQSLVNGGFLPLRGVECIHGTAHAATANLEHLAVDHGLSRQHGPASPGPFGLRIKRLTKLQSSLGRVSGIELVASVSMIEQSFEDLFKLSRPSGRQRF